MATASQFPNLSTRIPGAMIDTLFWHRCSIECVLTKFEEDIIELSTPFKGNKVCSKKLQLKFECNEKASLFLQDSTGSYIPTKGSPGSVTTWLDYVSFFGQFTTMKIFPLA